MGRRSGYKYSYNFWVEDEIIPLYNGLLCDIRYVGSKGFLFEIRTSFKIKSRVRVDNDGGGDIMMMGSERFGAAVHEFQDETSLQLHTNFRLNDDYWMSDDEIITLFRNALDFAKKQRAVVGPVTPVVVGLDVWTVQRKGEPINATIDRAIKLESLMPLHMWPHVVPKGSMQLDEESAYLDRKGFLRKLSRIRVENEVGLAFTEMCPVCSRNPIIGAQISFLPCGHACHSRCVFEWLCKGNYRCPLCSARIPADWDRLRINRIPIDLEELRNDWGISCESSSELEVSYGSSSEPGILYAASSESET